MDKKDKSLKKLVPYYKKYILLVIMVIVLSIGYSAVSLLSPIYEGKMLGFFETFDKIQIIKTAVFLLVIRLIMEILLACWSKVVLKLNGNISFNLKCDMTQSLTNFEIKNYDNTSTGVFLSRISKDATELSKLFDCLTEDVSDIVLNAGFIIYVFFLNSYLGIFLIINVVIIHILTSKKLYYYKIAQKEYKNKDEKMLSIYTDIIRGIREIKLLNLKDSILKKSRYMQKETINTELESLNIKRDWLRTIKATQHLLDFLFVLLSIFFISNKSITVSTFLIIFLYKNKLNALTNAISEIREKIADGNILAKRVFDIIDYESFSKEHYGNININNIKGNIEFRNVEFGYNENALFHNLNFKIQANKMIAIVGKSGEGKTSILNLICKNYNVNSGEVLIDGIDINCLSERTIRNCISIVSQSPYIFNLSIKENIKLFNPKASDEEIKDVCKKAELAKIIDELPNGYDTIVGENGIKLSGGQKQRLAIARALIKKSKIILFDEATSSLDNSNQEKIKSIIRNLTKDHTVVIVAHRLSTIMDADDIYVLSKHKIVGEGTHQELMNKCEEYQDLYKKEKK